MDDLALALVGLIRVQKETELTKTVNNQTLLQMFDRLSYEVEDEDKSIKSQHLSEVYYQVMLHEVLKEEIDASSFE